jgi:hypothetical protein
MINNDSPNNGGINSTGSSRQITIHGYPSEGNKIRTPFSLLFDMHIS